MKMKLSFHYVSTTLSICTNFQNSKTWLKIITLKADADELTPFKITELARLK